MCGGWAWAGVVRRITSQGTGGITRPGQSNSPVNRWESSQQVKLDSGGRKVDFSGSQKLSVSLNLYLPAINLDFLLDSKLVPLVSQYRGLKRFHSSQSVSDGIFIANVPKTCQIQTV